MSQLDRAERESAMAVMIASHDTDPDQFAFRRIDHVDAAGHAWIERMHRAQDFQRFVGLGDRRARQ
jgi:hypothetical protein